MHRARAIATALCLMGATACTQTPPISTPTSSPASATSMTTTSTPSGPASSSPADETAAILDATKRYFEEFSSALHTRDTTKFRTTFLTLCVVCLEDADKIDALLRSGQTIEGGSLRLTNMEITALNGDNAVVAGSLTADMTTVLDGSRRVVETYPTMTRSRNIALKRVEGKWSVQAFLD